MSLPDPENQHPCPHYGTCGGCAEDWVAYPAQLARKAAELHQVLGSWWPTPVAVTGSPCPWHYRNKAELKFDRRQYDTPPPPGFVRETVLGFRRRHQWYWTLDLEACWLLSPELPLLLQAVHGWYQRQGWRYYDSRSDRGVLKYLVVREGKRSGQRLVALITASRECDGAALAAAVTGAWPGATVVWGVNPGPSDVAIAPQVEVLTGPGWIEETLELPEAAGPRRLRFRIPPFGFFQVNPPAAELLYGAIRQFVRDAQPQALYDLYGGAGGIALSCADLAPRVVSVEEFAPASAEGVVNATLNGVTGVQFVTAKVEDYLRDQRAGGWAANSVAILDPPRGGLHPRVMPRLLALAPAAIVFVSCNPPRLAPEMPSLLAAYEPVTVQAFDLFPHTPHVEVLACFVRRPG